jgi:hypothetical protein
VLASFRLLSFVAGEALKCPTYELAHEIAIPIPFTNYIYILSHYCHNGEIPLQQFEGRNGDSVLDGSD